MYEHEVTMHRYLVAFRAKKSSLVPWFFVNARTESGPVKKKRWQAEPSIGQEVFFR